MKITPIVNEDISQLYSWHAHIYKLNNRKHIIFINDLSRLCVIIDGVRTSQMKILKEKFLSTLEEYLLSEHVSQSLVNAYISNSAEILISKTNNRSVLGTMKEMTMYTTSTHVEFRNHIERLKWVNSLIYKPIEYKKPRDVFKEAISNLM